MARFLFRTFCAGPAWTAVLLCMGAGCTSHDCTNQVVKGLPSPDGAFIAFVFYRRCAGAAAASTNVSIVRFQDSLRNDPGNVFAARDEQPVKASWKNPTRLRVAGFKDATYQRDRPIESITLEFQPER